MCMYHLMHGVDHFLIPLCANVYSAAINGPWCANVFTQYVTGLSGLIPFSGKKMKLKISQINLLHYCKLKKKHCMQIKKKAL